MRNIYLDGIMGVILGDALGLPVQFLDREDLAENPVTEMEGFGTFNMPPGTWSDDGSMTLATLDSIREKQGIDHKDMMSRFVAWNNLGHYTPAGIAFDQGATCLEAIYRFETTGDTATCGKTGPWANGNGALMRIMPVCLYVYEKRKRNEITLAEAVEMVHTVSALTHNHLRSKMACGIYYFLTEAILDQKGNLAERLQQGMDAAGAYYGADLMNLAEWIHYARLGNMEEFAQIPVEEIRSTGYVVDSLEAAVWSLLRTESFREALLTAVNLGKDTDTVGAIAGGLAGLYYGYAGMPKEWLEVVVKREEIEALCEFFIIEISEV